MTSAEFIYTVLLRPKPLKRLANRVIRMIIPAELKRHGATIVLNPNDPVISGALTFGVYEKSETELFRNLCRPGMTFLDIGANVGYYTALAIAGMEGSGKIIAVEPDRENFQYLERTVTANGGGNVTCIQKAAADRSGFLTLYVSSENRGDNRLYANELSDGSYSVEVSTIDSILSDLGVDAVDLIKMDVQGFEGQVLQGMRETIRRSKGLVMLTEFWPYGLASAGSKPAEILRDLESAGLTLYEVHSSGKIEKIDDQAAFISRYDGRKYASLVGVASAAPRGWMKADASVQ